MYVILVIYNNISSSILFYTLVSTTNPLSLGTRTFVTSIHRFYGFRCLSNTTFCLFFGTVASFSTICISVLKYIYVYNKLTCFFLFYIYQDHRLQYRATFPCQNKNKWHNPFSFPLQNYILFLLLYYSFLFHYLQYL